MYELVHFLHLASGLIWAGGVLAFAFVVEPTLLRLDTEQVRRHLAAQARFAGPFMGLSGIALLITGAARAAMSGGIGSPGDLLRPYGLWVVAALAIVLLVTIHGAVHRAAIARLLSGEGDVIAGLRPLQRRHALVTGAGILATIAIMTILGMGLY